MHHFLVISAVVMHDKQHGNAVVHSSPDRSVGLHHVAVCLNAHAKTTVLLVRKGSPDGNRQPASNSAAACFAHQSIKFVVVPQAAAASSDRGPILSFNRIPDLDRQS